MNSHASLNNKNGTPSQKIPGDRDDGRSSFVHRAIVTSGKLGALSPTILLPLWVLLHILVFRLWQHNKLAISLLAAVAFASDWIILGLLPVKNRSWGPVTPSLLGLLLLRTFFRMFVGFVTAKAWGLLLILMIELAISLIAIYATWIEPFNIAVTRKTMHLPAAMLSNTLRILHISDIHYEGDSPREAQLLNIIESNHPDLIVLTGDYLNLSSVFDPQAHSGVKQLLRRFSAPLGVYAVTGSPAVDHIDIIPEIFKGLDIHWLHDEVHCLNHSKLRLCIVGIVNTYDTERDINALTQTVAQCPKHSFSLLLYHTPDLIPEAAELGVNLYFCGHTHGGQISLPLYGALVTSSKWGKRFERGLYQVKNTILYVSRGLGMEGMGAPRARVFARPEVVLWTFKPDPTLTDTPSIV